MLDREEINWLKRSANELNNLLQEISASAYRIESLSSAVPEISQYLAITVGSVERASKTTAAMLQRVREAEALQGSETATAATPQAPAPQPAPSAPTAPESAKPSFGQFRVISGGAPEPVAALRRVQPGQGLDPAVFEAAEELHFEVANPNGDKELILMVDDENAVLMLAKMMLTDAGYKVIAVQEPVKALQIFRRISHQVTLVILDYAMPVMDGGELFDEMRAVDPQVGVVLSSGFADQTKLSRMLARGLNGFIPKPYTPEKLLLQVRSVLDFARSAAPGR